MATAVVVPLKVVAVGARLKAATDAVVLLRLIMNLKRMNNKWIMVYRLIAAYVDRYK